MTGLNLPDAKAQAGNHGRNVSAAANKYAETDQNLSQRLSQQQFDENGNPIGGAGTDPSSGADGSGGMGGMEQMGQMMQMPMQMAQQMGQAPMAMMGMTRMAGMVPQMAMQAAQQFGKAGGKGGADAKNPLDGQPGDQNPDGKPQDADALEDKPRDEQAAEDQPSDDKPAEPAGAAPSEAKPQTAPAPVQQNPAPAERMEPLPTDPWPTVQPSTDEPFKSINL